MESENTKFKQYLLSNLPARETEAIDLQIITDARFDEKLSWAESELMEDYLDDALAPAEVELFEKNFLVSPERKSGLRQIALLRKYARNAEAKIPPAAPPENALENIFVRMRNLFSPRLRVVAALTLVALIAAIGLVIYINADKSTNLEKEYAGLNQRDLSGLAEYGNLTNINLFPGVYRDTSGTGKLPEGKLTEQVLFRLALPVEANRAERFQIQIIRDGKAVFTQNKIRFYNNPNGQELRLLLPSAVLKKGAYQIKVEKEDTNKSTVFYNFAVQ